MLSDPLAWPFFTPRHRALAERLGAWQAELPAEPAELLAALGTAGWLAEAIPEAGEAIDCRALFLIREALAASDGRADRALLAHAMAAAPLVHAGTEEQRARLDGARQGSWRLAAAGFARDSAFTLTEEGEALHIAGHAVVPFGAAADAYVVIAGEGTARSALLITRDDPGVTVTAREEDADLRLADCQLSQAARIGAGGDGGRLAALTRELFGASAPAAALGLARLLLERLAAHAADRAVFGRRLDQYQALQEELAGLATRIEAARLLVYRAAWARDLDGSRMPYETSMARLAGFAATRAAIAALEAHLPAEAAWLADIGARFAVMGAEYDPQMEALLLAGQTLTRLRPDVDGWHGRAREAARS